MPVKKEDASRALDLLEQYHRRLGAPEDAQLRLAIERVMKIFQSKLFNALIEIQEFYEVTLMDEAKSAEQKTQEAQKAADRWASGQNLAEAQKGQPRSRRSDSPASDAVAPGNGQDAGTSEVVLQRLPQQSFGFSIAGGIDEPHLSPDDPRVCVTKVVTGGVADGRLRVGDVILAVNGVEVTAVTHASVVQALKASGAQLRLLLLRPKQLEVLLTKTAKGLGFSIAGGCDNQHLVGDDSFFVTRIIEGGAAQLDGRIQFGDRLLAVDGVSLQGASHQQAVAALKATGARAALVLLRPSAEQLQQLAALEQWAEQPEQHGHSTHGSRKPGKKERNKSAGHESFEDEDQLDGHPSDASGTEERKRSKGIGLFGKKKK